MIDSWYKEVCMWIHPGIMHFLRVCQIMIEMQVICVVWMRIKVWRESDAAIAGWWWLHSIQEFTERAWERYIIKSYLIFLDHVSPSLKTLLGLSEEPKIAMIDTPRTFTIKTWAPSVVDTDGLPQTQGLLNIHKAVPYPDSHPPQNTVTDHTRNTYSNACHGKSRLHNIVTYDMQKTLFR